MCKVIEIIYVSESIYLFEFKLTIIKPNQRGNNFLFLRKELLLVAYNNNYFYCEGY